MLRLAYLISRYPAISHTFILREVRELRHLGFDILTASINPPDRSSQLLSEEERQEAASTFVVKAQPTSRVAAALLRTLAVHPLKAAGAFIWAFRLAGWDVRALSMRVFYLLEAMVLGDWMRRESLHHLHVHFATPAATVALFVQRIFGLPFSMTVHGPDEFYSVGEYHLAEKVEAASFICCIGRYCRSQLMKLSEPRHWNKLEVAPLGVDPNLFRSSSAHGPRAKFRILCVGRLVPAKGQAVLLAALRLLREKGREVEVLFAGDGPDRQRLTALAQEWTIAEDCRFLGAVNPDAVKDLYAEADLFVLPSFAEGIPVVLMEAMAMGLPCISTFVNGIPELIESGREGTLVPPSDGIALSAAIEQLMDDAEMRVSHAANALEKVRTNYDLQANVHRLASIFRARMEPAA